VLEQKVAHFIDDRTLLTANSRLLVAVSTGVDSMVLIDILQKIQEQFALELGVVHVNHKLRQASDKEEEFLKKYCEQRQLPFFSTHWQNHSQVGMEEKARTFRYHFFAEIMTRHNYPFLATAHHGDDQMETMLMKMVRDGNFFSAHGIIDRQPFGQGHLIRPLLQSSKEEIHQYAQAEDILFFEDATNQKLDVQRNRIRQLVVPHLKAENRQVLSHFQQLSEQLIYAQETVVKQQQKDYQAMVKASSDQLNMDIKKFNQLSAARQFFLLEAIRQQARQIYQLTISQDQISQVAQLLQKNKANWQIDLVDNWQFQKSYEKLFLHQAIKVEKKARFNLHEGESVFLSEHEWIGIFQPGQEKIPEKIANWSEYRQYLKVDFSLPVTLRKRCDGDRIQLNPQLKKKVARILIDQKIPQKRRERAWVLTDKNEKVLAVLPYAISYLCISQETAKIHYVLLYKYCK